MAQTIQMITQVHMGDVELDYAGHRAEALAKLAAFFAKNYFAHDGERFWFYSVRGEKVGVRDQAGDISQCNYGLFTSFKRMTVVQRSESTLTRNEFYVDDTKGELIVHRYYANHPVQSKTYMLAR
jgi:hypothetical protein